jgi:hypothetical protein
MPCAPSKGEEDFYRKLEKRLHECEYEAVICGMIKAGGEQILKTLDYKEIGVTETEVREWWEKHQERDNKRKL